MLLGFGLQVSFQLSDLQSELPLRVQLLLSQKIEVILELQNLSLELVYILLVPLQLFDLVPKVLDELRVIHYNLNSNPRPGDY